MATTAESEAMKDQQPIVRRRVGSLEELIERFHDPQTSLEECHGLFSSFADLCGRGGYSSVEISTAAVFLMEIGSECEPWHLSTAKHRVI